MRSPAVRPGTRPGSLARRAIVAAIATIGLAGCTSGFVYDRLDWVVSWYVGGLVSLDEEQDRRLETLVESTLDWHRRTQLPRYVRLLEEMAAESAAPLDAAAVGRRYAEVEVLLDDFIRQVNPGVAGLLATLSPGQVDELAGNLAEDNEELWEDFAGATPERRRAQRTKNAVKALQRFYGRLTPAQKALVDARLQRLNDVSEDWIERREHWQERLIAMLSPPAEGLEGELLDLALRPNQFDTPEYRRRVDANRRVIFEMVAELSTTLTDEQRRHVERKFRSYATDLREVAARN